MFRMICTHNPQDFFEGMEPQELSKTILLEDLPETMKSFAHDGYYIIVYLETDGNQMQGD